MHTPSKHEAMDASRVLSDELQTLDELATEAVYYPNEVKVVRLQEVRRSLSSLHARIRAGLARGAAVPVDPTDPWRGLYDPATLPARDDMGETHIHDLRGPTAGGSHLVDCACRATSKSQDLEKALADRHRNNCPPCIARAPAAPVVAANVVQFNLRLTEPSAKRNRARASTVGGCT